MYSIQAKCSDDNDVALAAFTLLSASKSHSTCRDGLPVGGAAMPATVDVLAPPSIAAIALAVDPESTHGPLGAYPLQECLMKRLLGRKCVGSNRDG